MSRKKKRRNRDNAAGRTERSNGPRLPKLPIKEVYNDIHPETRTSIWAIVFLGVAVVLALAKWSKAGPFGDFLASALTHLLGWGYFILPVVLVLAAGIMLFREKKHVIRNVVIGTVIVLLAALGLIDIYSAGNGGWLGRLLGALKYPFKTEAATIINILIFAVGLLIVTNASLRLTRLFSRDEREEDDEPELSVVDHLDDTDELVPEEPPEEAEEEKPEENVADQEPVIKEHVAPKTGKRSGVVLASKEALANYVAPPLDLLNSSTEKPTTGDLRANANIIKRTLESFGIAVEMGEINIGPKVTRYTLKPAEGMKLSRITALAPDLALALAAHPIRIEAPIPGKSLVGIEVPNKQAALVRLGNLLNYPEFSKSGPLGIVLGRDVSGEPIFANIAKMPHLLIAGATGSGKSIFVHGMLTSLLFKNSPAMLKLALIDPKRVELTMYNNLPHLALPVVTENKKALAVFRWAIQEMEDRYELLSHSGSRDIGSYNAKHADEPMPYIIIVVDELADLMATYGREIEGSIIRLAQMARATGIHLILATQRPSVEVITGLIKANITNRVALQVASQIDSRTILDMAGAEKLLGGGDLLFLAPEHSQPKRIQNAYITEEEIRKVTDFIKEHNRVAPPVAEIGENENGGAQSPPNSLEDLDDYLQDEDDTLFHEAVTVVATAKKASASLLQRRLKVGYARAARLLDLMEERDLIGPGEGAKPREVYDEKVEDYLERS
jgi:S-DNA-T family DNA segregation ATPase FtsK/SpoIIIE